MVFKYTDRRHAVLQKKGFVVPKTLNGAKGKDTSDSKRPEALDPDRVISMIPLRPYHVVADIRCGSGHFSIPLAKYISQGKLYAVDTKKETIESCRQRLSEVHLENVEVIHSRAKRLPIDKNSLDGAFLGFALHQIEDKKGLLTETARLLQPGGWVAIIEWSKMSLEEGPSLENRVSEDEVKELCQLAGLRFVSQRDLNGKNYLALFRK